MTPTTLDMARTKSLIESDMQERMVWRLGGYWTTVPPVVMEYGDAACVVFDSKEATNAAMRCMIHSYNPRLIPLSKALRYAKEWRQDTLLLLDETMTVIESWPVR